MDEDGNALTITVGDPGMGGGPGGGQGGPGGMTETPEEYAAANEYTEDTTVENTSLESAGTDENAALISEGANAVFDGVEITRTSSESKGGDASSFYGVGAALLAEDGTALVKNSTITVSYTHLLCIWQVWQTFLKVFTSLQVWKVQAD